MRSIPVWDSFKMSWYRAMQDTDDPLLQSRRRIFLGNQISSVASYLTSGVFYTTLILILFQGQPDSLRNEYIGRISIIQSICAMMQMVSPLFLERMKSHKVYIMTLRTIYHFLDVFGLALIPILPFDVTIRANLLVIVSSTMSLYSAMYSPGLSSWHIYSLTEGSRSDYFAVNSIVSSLVSTVFSLLTSVFMDYFAASGKEYTAIIIMRGVAIFLIAIETKAFFGVAEPVYEKTAGKGAVWQILTVPLRYPKFLFCALISGVWSFSQSVGGIYYQTYLLTDGQMKYTFISIVGLVGMPLSILAMPIWNQLIRKHGWFSCMAASTFLCSLTFVCNGLVTPKTHYLYLLGSLYYVMVHGGVSLASSNLPYIYLPKNGQSSCLAFYSTVGSLFGLLCSWVAKEFIMATEGIDIHIFGLTLLNEAYACFLSFAGVVLTGFLILIMCRINKKDRMKEEAEEEAMLN